MQDILIAIITPLSGLLIGKVLFYIFEHLDWVRIKTVS